MDDFALEVLMNYPGLCVMRAAKPGIIPVAELSEKRELQVALNNQTATESLIRVFSANVQKFRLDCGYSRAHLCQMANIRTSSFYNIEHCVSCARLDTVEKIARALNVPASELLRY